MLFRYRSCFRFSPIFPYAAPKYDKRCYELCGDATRSIDQNIGDGGSATRHERLVKLVKSGITGNDENGG